MEVLETRAELRPLHDEAEEEQPRKVCPVSFLPTKVASFFYFGSKLSLITYLVPFLMDTGMRPSQAGLIVAIRFIMTFLGGLLLGWAIDATKRYTLFTFSTIIGSISSVLFMIFLPYSLYGRMDDGPRIANVTLRTTETRMQSYNMSAFFIVMLFCSVYSCLDGSLYGSLDSFTLFYCRKYGTRNSYYKQRLWGSVGYGICPLLIGLLVHHLNVEYISKYLPALLTCLGLKLILLPVFVFLAKEYAGENPHNQEILDDEIKKDQPQIISTLRKPLVMLCLFLQFMFGMGNVVEFSFLLIFMKEHMINGTTTVLGFSVLSHALTEAVVTPFTGRLQSFINNPYILFSFGILGYGTGFLFYFFTSNAYFIILVNVLFGTSYALVGSTMTIELSRLSQRNCLTFILTLSNASFSGIGGGVGCLIGGYLYDYFGPRIMYVSIACTFQMIGMCLFGFSIKCNRFLR